MAKLLAFSVRDAKVEAFMSPMWFRSNGEALRSFMDAVNESGTPFARHAEDYSLWVLGEFDDQTGKLVASSAMPEKVSSGIQVKSGPQLVKESK